MTIPNLDPLAIFSEAVVRESGEERARYLDEACRDNPEARRRVEALLRAHFDAGGFLGDRPPEEDQTIEHRIAEQPGEEIGPYKLLQVIGEGGMGVVYMAEQTAPVARRVALKIIKPGMDTGQVIARFEAERQALAMMDHPNIAKVLDAGATDSGRPYFVMELVKGIPISDYCAEQHFTPKQRLELFVTVCQAVQHAHQKGVIHRDLKPSNVLVAEYDQQAVPKVIDFGVAKATSQKLTEKTMFTQYGQIVGTLEYMSPEQAKLNQLDIDTRSDVYSLGALLYHLLTGTTPFERERLQAAAFEEMLRIIREEEPPKPSTRISTLGKSAGALSGYQRSSPQKLHQIVRGELDWIVMKALEKERGRRYQSASSFAADIGRFLSGEAVMACPPSRVYRARKFVRRNWAPVAAGTALLLALCLGLIGTLLGMREAEAQSRVAEQQRNLVTENLYYAEMNMAGEAAREQSGTARVKSLLDHWLPSDDVADFRGWEWYFLRSLCNQDLFTLDAHDGAVNSLAWSPDRKRLASAGEDRSIKIWALDERRLRRTLKGHTAAIYSISWSSDGARIASASGDNTVKVWDAETGRLERTLEGHGFPVMSVAWNPDSTRIASAGGQPFLEPTRDKEFNVLAIVWNADTGDKEHILRGHTGPIMDICWSPDGERLASGGGKWLEPEHQTVRIWDARTGRQQRVIKLTGRCSAVAWSPDGKSLAYWSFDRHMLHVWDVDAAEERIRFRCDGARRICWSPDSSRLSAVGSSKVVQVFDAETGENNLNFRTVGDNESVSWSRDGELLASGSLDGSVKIWDPAAITDALEFGGHPAGVVDASWNQQGDRIATVGRDTPEIRVWDSRTGQLVREFDAHSNGALSVAWNRNGKWLASGGPDDSVKIWDAASGKQLHDLSGHGPGVWRVRWSRDGRWLATAGRDGALRVWDVREREQRLVHQLQHSSTLVNTSWNPHDNRLAAAVFFPGEVDVWNLSSGRRMLGPLPHRGFLFSLQWSPDGRLLAVGGQSGDIQILDGETGEQMAMLTQSTTVNSVAWSPDGHRLAAAGASGRVKIWDPARGKEALTLVTKQPAHQVRWSPDGQRLAVGSFPASGREDQQITIWDARVGYEIERQRNGAAMPEPSFSAYGVQDR